MSTSKESPLVKRIRALMAMANDKNIGETEAALFATKVQELLAEHGMSMADVRAVNDESVKAHDFGQRWKSPARKKLLRAVCDYYMCEALSPGDKHDTWTIIGRPHNVTVAVEMTDYLIKTVIRMSNEYGKKHGKPGGAVIDFRRGAMMRLATRLTQKRREITEQKAVWKGPGKANPGNLPALFSSEQALIDSISETFNPVERPARKLKIGDDAVEGWRAAEDIGLHDQVTSGTGRLMIGKG
jgi:hypothetical protein